MNGRIENDMRIYKRAECLLDEYPQFVINWYYYLKANKKSATTCLDYLHKVRHFLKCINDDISIINPDDITDTIVLKYFIDIQTKDIIKNGKRYVEYTSDSYQQCVWSCLNSLFDFMKRKNMIVENLIEKLNIERPKNRDLHRINRNRLLLTEADFRAILMAAQNGVGSNKAKGYQKAFRNRDVCMLNIFMTTGVRKSALAAINIEDIDFEKKILTVIDKGSIIHEYNLSDTTIDYIQTWLNDRQKLVDTYRESALFISKENRRISNNSIDKIVSKYSVAALGYNISPHKIRAGFISIVQSKTHDIEFTRRVAGHSNVATTQRYIVTDNLERKRASMMMEKLLQVS